MTEILTIDPYVVILEQREGYIHYRDTLTNKEWIVLGVCDRRGDCLIGSSIDTPEGKVTIRNHEHLAELSESLGRERIDTELDVPVTPEFIDCCPFTYIEL